MAETPAEKFDKVVAKAVGPRNPGVQSILVPVPDGLDGQSLETVVGWWRDKKWRIKVESGGKRGSLQLKLY